MVATLVAAPSARAATPVLTVEGRGWGHGVGMSQDGAFWMAKAGSTTEEILSHFYPGTRLDQARGPVRVAVLTPGGSGISVTLPEGGEVRDSFPGSPSPGWPLPVPPGREVVLSFDGSRYHAHVPGTTPAPPAPPAPAPPSPDPPPDPAPPPGPPEGPDQQQPPGQEGAPPHPEGEQPPPEGEQPPPEGAEPPPADAGQP